MLTLQTQDNIRILSAVAIHERCLSHLSKGQCPPRGTVVHASSDILVHSSITRASRRGDRHTVESGKAGELWNTHAHRQSGECPPVQCMNTNVIPTDCRRRTGRDHHSGSERSIGSAQSTRALSIAHRRINTRRRCRRSARTTARRHSTRSHRGRAR